MKQRWICLVVLVGNLAFAQDASPKVSVTRWPGDRAAAISLTFDDGINSDLDSVGPILRKHHLNGTFFVATAMGPWEKRKPEWKQLSQAGDELANHTVHHPCLLPQITPHAQEYTPEMMEAEVRDGAEEIARLVGYQRGLTFAYPCGNMSFGKPEDEVRNAVLYARYVSDHAFAARAVGNGAENPDDLNVLAIKDLGPTAGKDYVALLELGEPAIRSGLWGVYCFHGVGGDWLSIRREVLDELAAYLERHSEIWTATFGDVLRYIQERKAASVQLKQMTIDHMDLTMNWPMDRKIYDVPLTLKVEVPSLWTDVTALGDGNRLEAKIVDRTKGTTILVDVPAETTLVQLTNRGLSR